MGLGILPPKPTWKGAVERYKTEVAPRAIKPSVAKRYEISLDQMDEWLGNLTVDQLTVKVIADMVSGRQRMDVSHSTIRNDLTAVSRVLAACIAWGYRADNPAKAYDRSLIRYRADPISLPPEDHIEAMIAASPPGLAALQNILRYTGMRLEEAATLEWNQIDLKEKRKAINLTITKTDRVRSIPLDDIETSKAAEILKGIPRYLRARKTETSQETHGDFVFWHDDGQPYHEASSGIVAIRQRLNRKRKKEGLRPIKYKTHDLRHNFAVTYLRDGGNIYNLQQLLGHSSIKVTEAYLQYLTPNEQMRAKFGGGVAHREGSAQ